MTTDDGYGSIAEIAGMRLSRQARAPSAQDAVACWPFVVSRNRNLDWRPVLAPEFLVRDGTDFSLVYRTAGDGGHPFRFMAAAWPGETVPALRYGYRSVRLTGEYVAGIGDGDINDRFGRPIYVIEGLFVEENTDASPDQMRAAIEHARPLFAAALQKFWEEDTEAAPPQVSRKTCISHREVRCVAPGSERGDVVLTSALSRLITRVFRRGARGRVGGDG